MILSITGHRPPRLGGYRDNPVHAYVRERIDHRLMQLRPERVILGMAQGVDTITAQLCVANDIPFVAAIPCPNFEAMWPPNAQERYRDLLGRAAEVVFTSSDSYTRDSTRVRNRWMLQHSQRLLAVWDGARTGGTWMTMDMARFMGLGVDVELLPPNIVRLASDLFTADEQRRAEMRRIMESRHGPSPGRVSPGTFSPPPPAWANTEHLVDRVRDRVQRIVHGPPEGEEAPLPTFSRPASPRQRVENREAQDNFKPRRCIDVGED